MSKLKILCVDDVEVNIAVLVAAMERKYDVYVARAGEEALVILDQHPDMAAVITDIRMPDMDGKVLIQTIRADGRFQDMAVLANTQYGDFQQEERLKKMGADDFLYKPSEPAEVLARLEQVLKTYGRS